MRTSTTGGTALVVTLIGAASAFCSLSTAIFMPPAAAAESCELTVAWDPYEPYSYAETPGEPPLGYDVDVVSRISGMIGCELEFKRMQWSDILDALHEGQVDMTLGTGYKPDRAAWSWYSESYREELVGLLLRRGTADEFAGAGLQEVFGNGLVFGKTTDDTYDADALAVFAKYPDQVQKPVSESENMQRLLEGSIDGFLIEVHVAAALMKKAGVAERMEFHPLSFDAGAYRLQMSRKTVSAGLVARMNEAIQQLAYDGWFNDLNAKYRQ